MNFIEKEIKSGVSLFARQFNVNITPSQMASFMNLVHENRKIKLGRDTFLQVCKFLVMADIVRFISTCKEYHIYEQYIWGIIQADYFPTSLIPKIDYKHIRSKIALDYYYFLKSKCNCLQTHEKEIAEDEAYMVNRYNELMEINNNSSNGKIRLLIIKEDLKSLRNSRESRLANIPISNDRYRLLNLSQCSIMDPTGVPYYTIKQDIDMALYGLDKFDPYESKIGGENNKWITGEYNNIREYDYDSDEETKEPSPPIFEYHNNHLGIKYRFRIKPQYIKDIENKCAKKCSCTNDVSEFETDDEFYARMHPY
jgi:hypothetical protein